MKIFLFQALTLKQAIKNDFFDVAAKSRLWSIAHSKTKFRRYFWTKEKRDDVFNFWELTNISPNKALLKMIFVFPRWDMLVP